MTGSDIDGVLWLVIGGLAFGVLAIAHAAIELRSADKATSAHAVFPLMRYWHAYHRDMAGRVVVLLAEVLAVIAVLSTGRYGFALVAILASAGGGLSLRRGYERLIAFKASLARGITEA